MGADAVASLVARLAPSSAILAAAVQVYGARVRQESPTRFVAENGMDSTEEVVAACLGGMLAVEQLHLELEARATGGPETPLAYMQMLGTLLRVESRLALAAGEALEMHRLAWSVPGPGPGPGLSRGPSRPSSP